MVSPAANPPPEELEQKERLDVTARLLPEKADLLPKASLGTDGFYHLFVKDTAELGKLAKNIADSNGEIIRVAKNKIDLEDFFVRVVREREK